MLSFYSDPAYKYKQSEKSKINWQLGKYNNLIKPNKKLSCGNPKCTNTFETKPYNPKLYCSLACAATINNHNRIHSPQTRHKISLWAKNHAYLTPHPHKSPILLVCQNNACRKNFTVLPYLAKKRKYCTVSCSIITIGRQTTSPRASKGKSGIRQNINPNICFYSTWEANMARVYNLLELKWEYAPKMFNLITHTYKPDFYLPSFQTYIEVKNYMNSNSAERDRLFRIHYPHVNLELILKKEYQEIEKEYKPLIEDWE